MMDRDTFEAEYRAGYQPIVRAMLARGATPEDAHDLAQQSWLRAWEKREQFRGDNGCTFLTWVHNIGNNVLTSVHRHLKTTVHGRAISFEACDCPEPGAETDPNVNLRCEQAIRRAGPNGFMLRLHYIEGVSVEEIAGRHGKTRLAVRITMLRARRRARERCE